MKIHHRFSLSLWLALTSLSYGVSARGDTPPASLETIECRDTLETRRAYFGDLHVHTSYSSDAYFRMGARTTPHDAYRFARGQAISLPPFDMDGRSGRQLKLDRSLDFAAVTDHAEDLADVRLCSDPLWGENDRYSCTMSGKWKTLYGLVSKKISEWRGDASACDAADGLCKQAKKQVWSDIIDSAEAHNSPCEFTSFIGYEWSGVIDGANMHRNIIFRNRQVVDMPMSALDLPTPEQLWGHLDESCRDAGNSCEAITIPHNMNLSKGRLFSQVMSNGEPMTKSVAQQRQDYDTLAEILQHKGDSECFYQSGFTEDELCNFEKLPYDSFLGKYVSYFRKPPKNDTSYMREALREGFRLQEELDINPFMTGFIGGTDTHFGAPGSVSEQGYPGHHGDQNYSDDFPIDQQMPDFIESNPGGLAVVYAENNTRESLFDGMKRREAYGTSGPRMLVRFFSGDDLPETMCQLDDQNLAAEGYANGVPMGGVLHATSSNSGPKFVVSASQDPGTKNVPGHLLQKIQIVKGWVDDEGVSQESVFDVQGAKTASASIGEKSCEPITSGANQLCKVWKDPNFDPTSNAYYYAKVVENPSCRWNTFVCLANQVDCSNPEAVPDGLAQCCDSSIPKTIQERAWTSPIWFSPE
jgi:Protein of unknown function (DUF3604)